MSQRAGDDATNAALQAALVRLLAPLAQLAVARGVPFAVVDEMLRAAFVSSAHAAHPGLPEHRRASRVSAATGLNRREVNRLLDQQHAAARKGLPAATPRSPAAVVFAHWRATPAYRTRAGAPRVLPRTGPAPSFESLAHEVTRDVHPRALLEELLRLKLATHDTARDSVAPKRVSKSSSTTTSARRVPACRAGRSFGSHSAQPPMLKSSTRSLNCMSGMDGWRRRAVGALRWAERTR